MLSIVLASIIIQNLFAMMLHTVFGLFPEEKSQNIQYK